MHWICTVLLFYCSFLCATSHVAINPRELFTELPRNGDQLLEKEVLQKHENCTPLVSCPAHVRIDSVQFCTTKANKKGCICTTGQNHTENNSKSRHAHRLHMDKPTLGAIKAKVKYQLAEQKTKKQLLKKFKTVLHPGPATYGHFRNSRSFDHADLGKMMSVAEKAIELALATRAFKDRQGLSGQDLELSTFDQNLQHTEFGHNCNRNPFCPFVPAKYRRIDGSCNNPSHPTWGAPFTTYSRLLPASYQDGIWSPRVSVVDGEPLPSSRLVSTTIVADIDAPNPDFTQLLMQFGQFLSHDFTQSMDMSFENGSAISCCDEEGTATLPPDGTHEFCMPIVIPESDDFFSTYGQRCMNFVRTILAPRHDCALGYAQQMNKLTHFIDLSSVYGSTPEQTGELRSFQSGKLKVFKDYGRELLPMSKDPEACLTMEQGSACFSSGDTRTNQMITLVVMHTLFLREHNRIADVLSQLNPHWTDEQIFLEARNIHIAEMQVIVYKEYLPAILGEEAMSLFNLNLQTGHDYSSDYNPEVDPSVMNEFAAAAFRFGHSTVDGQLKLYGMRKMEELVHIPEVMFYPSRMRHREFLDECLSTLTTEPIQDVDVSLSDALTKYMFRGGNPFGVDLAAINVQRGRDHGLRPYNDYRELVGLPKVKSFEEFGPEMSIKLRSVYKSVDDIDLWVGGLLEPKAPGSLVGLTFRDIMAEQFMRFKRGDRYFFENEPRINPGHFTQDQLVELRKASMSRIICDNSDKMLLSRQARNAFRKPGVPGNEFVDCSGPEIAEVNLRLWQK